MTLPEVVTQLKKETELIDTIKAQLGETFDFANVTALEGTTEEKSAKLEALITSAENLQAEEARMKKLVGKLQENAERKGIYGSTAVNNLGGIGGTQNSTATKSFKSFELPATVRRYGSLKTFKGARAEENAFAFGQFVLATIAPHRAIGQSAKSWLEEHGLEVKALEEGNNAAGGFLVPHQFENMLIDLRAEYGVIRKYAKIVPMTSDTRSDPRKVSGLTAYAVGDPASGTQSTQGWDRVSLTAKDWMVLTKMSNSVSADAIINLGDDIAYDITYAFAQKADDCAFIGDGTSTYHGIVGITNKLLNLSATRANIAGLVVGAGNAWSELTRANFTAVTGRLPAKFDKNASWFVHKTFFSTVMQEIALAAGGAEAREVSEGVRAPKFLGYPVVFTESMPKVEANDQVCAILGDLSQGVRFGDRAMTTIAVSDAALNSFEQNETAIRGIERWDINVHDVGNESGTAASRVAGPIVGLLTAAS